MKAINLINELKEKYKDDTILRKNGTMLLGHGIIPKAKHMLFKGLTQELLEEYLISQYENKFPLSYGEFLKYSNGADLFMTKIQYKNLEFASSNLTIYGLPRTPPLGRPNDMEEPFDVRIEDLSRHPKTPKTWLKVGRYKTKNGLGNEAYLFIDTNSGGVFSCRRDEYEVIEEWSDFDASLCCIIHRASL